MRLAIAGLGCVLVAVFVWLIWNSQDVLQWAVTQQRAFQDDMANGVFGLKTGSPGAWGTLLGATAAYGFVHALGPGHGKYLIGGVGLGSSVAAARLVGLAVLSSLAQALWAIILVYGGFLLFEASAAQMTSLAEDWLAPLSYIAIAGIGVAIAWRGLRALAQTNKARIHGHDHGHDHSHDDACGCGHAHGPTPDQAARVASFKDVVALVTSIAIRPCTGAIFLLVIAWQMDIKFAGAVAVIVMGFGTAALTSLVAVSSTAARSMTFATSRSVNAVHVALPALQILAGATVLLLSLGLLSYSF